jgi:hypothetical protein
MFRRFEIGSHHNLFMIDAVQAGEGKTGDAAATIEQIFNSEIQVGQGTLKEALMRFQNKRAQRADKEPLTDEG